MFACLVRLLSGQKQLWSSSLFYANPDFSGLPCTAYLCGTFTEAEKASTSIKMRALDEGGYWKKNFTI
jgi:hypothetical protein